MPRRPGFDAQTMHSFLVLFHLIKVARLVILVQEEGGQTPCKQSIFVRYICFVPKSAHRVGVRESTWEFAKVVAYPKCDVAVRLIHWLRVYM